MPKLPLTDSQLSFFIEFMETYLGADFEDGDCESLEEWKQMIQNKWSEFND